MIVKVTTHNHSINHSFIVTSFLTPSWSGRGKGCWGDDTQKGSLAMRCWVAKHENKQNNNFMNAARMALWFSTYEHSTNP